MISAMMNSTSEFENEEVVSQTQSFLRYNASPCVSKVTTNYGSMLDLAFIKVCSKSQVQTDVLEAYWSDHNVVYVVIDLSH
jgi:hypothetical protein